MSFLLAYTDVARWTTEEHVELVLWLCDAGTFRYLAACAPANTNGRNQALVNGMLDRQRRVPIGFAFNPLEMFGGDDDIITVARVQVALFGKVREFHSEVSFRPHIQKLYIYIYIQKVQNLNFFSIYTLLVIFSVEKKIRAI